MKRPVYYTQLHSPWGPLFLAGTAVGICSCIFIKEEGFPNRLGRTPEAHGVSMQKDIRPLASAVDALQGYFSAKTESLNHPVDIQGSHFQLQVWTALREIPLGATATYGEIAERIGKPGSGRAVGQACANNPVVLFVPCHRVVAARGKLGGFGGGLELKTALLRHEGVRI